MDKSPHRPATLKALCVAFLLWSALYVCEGVSRSAPGNLVFDVGALGFLAALGLWRLSPVGRKFAVFLTWYWLIGSVSLVLQLFPMKGLTLTSSSNFLFTVPHSILRALVVPALLVQLWQLFALNRPEIRELFERKYR